jgi:hypothetical protein
MRMALDSDKVTMGNGTDVSSAMQIAKLHRVICNKNGNELDGAVLDGVCHLPDAKFNLFSLSYTMCQPSGSKRKANRSSLI